MRLLTWSPHLCDGSTINLIEHAKILRIIYEFSHPQAPRSLSKANHVDMTMKLHQYFSTPYAYDLMKYVGAFLSPVSMYSCSVPSS